MQITNISVSEGRRFIPVKGWDGVKKAITVFENGCSRGSHATQNELTKQVEEEHGGFGLGIFLLGSITAGSQSGLVERLLLEAGQRLEKRNEFEKSYDYDGMGTSFFKTNVKIKRIEPKEQMFAIGLYAAYVGDKPEVGLAEYLGVPRTLLSCSAVIETEPVKKDRFEFDFEPVMSKLDQVLCTGHIAGDTVAKNMLEKDSYGEDKASFSLGIHGGFQVTIFPGKVERRMKFDRKARVERDTWSVEGSVFSGDLAQDFSVEDENAKARPTFVISVTSPDELDLVYRKEAAPIWRPEEQRKAVALTNTIAAALK
jgi:hypothetical protein